MIKETLEKAKAAVKKYHLDYLGIAAAGVAIGLVGHKLYMDYLANMDFDSSIGVEPYLLDGSIPGVKCNVYKELSNGKSLLSHSLIFDGKRFYEFSNTCFDCLKEAMIEKDDNE